MEKQQKGKRFLISLFLMAASLVTGKKPNVVIIFADDVGTGDVPGYWNTGLVDMPNLENLIANGVTFTDAHSTPVCAPSRYVLLSGNYQHRGTNLYGTWSMNYGDGNQFLRKQQSFANVFRDNGYNTAMFGKWHLGGKIPVYSNFTRDQRTHINSKVKTALSQQGHKWTRKLIGGPWDVGFDESYITLTGIQSPPYAWLHNSKFLAKDLKNLTYWERGEYPMPAGMSKIISSGEGAIDFDSSAYNMILVNKTKSFVNKHMRNRPNDPFLTYVALGAVHVPHSPPDKYLDGLPISGEYSTRHMDMLKEMDMVVGSITETLEANNLLNDTIILFASDNGGLGDKHGSSEFGHFSSGPLKGAKGSILEGGHRVPFIMRWDNSIIPKAEKRSNLVGLNDVFATLCDLAGIKVPNNQAIDSLSFARAFNYTQGEGLREFLGTWQYKKKQLYASAIRKNSMKLIYHHKTSLFSLFNLTIDLSETTNIIDNHPELVEEMKKQLRLIGPCFDNQERFVVSALSTNMTLSWKNCRWFGEKTRRCRSFEEGPRHCGASCAMEHQKECENILLSKLYQ